MVPSYDLTGPAFDPARYWRGPSWFNVGWLLHRGLRHYGAALDAKRLREDLLEAAGRTGFAEYVDPHSGDGRGIRSFSWTAATALDLIAEGAG
jgi:glycogen debranching enzyme